MRNLLLAEQLSRRVKPSSRMPPTPPDLYPARERRVAAHAAREAERERLESDRPARRRAELIAARAVYALAEPDAGHERQDYPTTRAAADAVGVTDIALRKSMRRGGRAGGRLFWWTSRPESERPRNGGVNHANGRPKKARPTDPPRIAVESRA